MVPEEGEELNDDSYDKQSRLRDPYAVVRLSMHCSELFTLCPESCGVGRSASLCHPKRSLWLSTRTSTFHRAHTTAHKHY